MEQCDSCLPYRRFTVQIHPDSCARLVYVSEEMNGCEDDSGDVECYITLGTWQLRRPGVTRWESDWLPGRRSVPGRVSSCRAVMSNVTLSTTTRFFFKGHFFLSFHIEFYSVAVQKTRRFIFSCFYFKHLKVRGRCKWQFNDKIKYEPKTRQEPWQSQNKWLI